MRRFFASLFLTMAFVGIASAQTGAPTFITNSTSLLAGASFNIGGSGTAGSLTANASGAAVVPLTVTGYSGQTADLEDWYNSTPSLLASISSTGAAMFPSLTLTTPLAIASGGTGTATAPTQWGIIYAASTTAFASTAAGSAGQLLTSNGTSAPTWTTNSGAVSNFTSALSTTNQYSTSNPGASWSATNSTATNIDVALTPKGTGAIEAQIADGTATGGNKRGENAVDWQTFRGANTDVASGNYSVVGGGRNNTSSGNSATVAGGDGNTASGNYSVVAGGSSNTASGNYSSVSGGFGANASLYGQNAQASGEFATIGDAQTSVYTAFISTSDATATTLLLDGPGGSNNLTLPSGGSWVFKVMIIGKTSGSPATVGAWEVSGTIYNNGGTATIVGTNVTTTYNTPTNWSVPTATGSGQNMVITVQGPAATNIQWVARIETAETIY